MAVEDSESRVRGFWTGMIVMFLVAVVMLAVVGPGRAGASVDVVGISYRSDSSFQLALVDNGMVYPEVEFHIFSDVERVYEVRQDGRLMAGGTAIGVEVRNVTFAGGQTRIAVKVGEWAREWNVVVLNRSAEAEIGATFLEAAGTWISTGAFLFEILKVHAVTLAFFFVPVVPVFRWVVRRKEREVRQIV